MKYEIEIIDDEGKLRSDGVFDDDIIPIDHMITVVKTLILKDEWSVEFKIHYSY